MYGRHHTAQYLKIQNHNLLIDCGEGTQLQIQKFGLKAQKLEAIFISHLHGDHYLGLVGLLSSMHLMGRTKSLELFGPPELAEIITIHLKYSDTTLRYKVNFHGLEMNESEIIYETRKFTVTSFPVEHRIPCVGFLFEEKQFPVSIDKKKLTKEITLADIGTLKRGEDVLDADGKVKYRNKDFTLGRKKSRSYAYCTDTLYLPELAEFLQGVDLLYHEATFMTEEELRATNTYHASAGQAAELARNAGVGQLLIGHFSARYRDVIPLQEEARKVFKESYVAEEGKTFSLEN
jgi:ribonuclease Z